MARSLQRLGRFSFRHRRRVVALWLGLLLVVGVGGALAGGKLESSFKLPGTESQETNDLLAAKLGSGAAGAQGRIVSAAKEDGSITRAQRSAIAGTLREVGAVDGVASVTDPFEQRAVSRDGRIAYATVSFTKSTPDAASQDAIADAEDAARDAGLTVATGGDAAQTPHAGAAELLGVLVAMLVLGVTFGALVAAGMPLLTAGVGVGVGVLSILLLAAVVELPDVSTALAVMLGLAVGIDYALFIISRHRQQVQDGMDPEDSAAYAVGTAGSAVVFAGLTVVIALVALWVTGIPFLGWMGTGAALTVTVAVLVAVTLVPAVLGFAGTRIAKGKRASAPATDDGRRSRTLGARWAALVVRHRVLATLLVLVVTLVMALPALGIRLGLPDDSTAGSEAKRDAYALLAEGFGPGFNGPLTVVAQVPAGTDAAQAGGQLVARLGDFDDVATVTPATVTPDKTLAILSVVPASGPSTEATTDLVRAIRDAEPALREATGTAVSVTGPTAINIDISSRVSATLIPYLLVVVGLALVLLTIAFRSLLVPLTAIGGFLLSIVAALGALVFVFQEGHLLSLFGVPAAAPIVSLIPTLLIGILFGLAMDYQVFLVSRMQEEHAHGAAPLDAVTRGFTHSARVVTAAALIMISVFAGFVLPDDPIIKSIGFALALGILVDAFLIRMTLVPALMSLLGARAWKLPAVLDRVLPHVDIEGTTLDRPRTADPRPAAVAASAAPRPTA